MSVRRVDQGMAAMAAQLLPAQVSPELRTRYRQLRVMLHTAGLAATYAFIAAKAGPPVAGDGSGLARAYQQAAAGIRQRLTGLGLLGGDPAQLSAREVLRQLGEMSAVEYARASTEATVFMGWLARLADAMCPPTDSTETGGAARVTRAAESAAGGRSGAVAPGMEARP